MDFGGRNEIFSIAKMNDQLLIGTDYSKLFSINRKDLGERYATINLSQFTSYSKNPIPFLTKRNRIYVLHSEGNDLYIGADAFLLKKKGSSAPVFINISPVKDIDVANKYILVCTGRNALLLNEADMSVKDTLLKLRATCGVIYQKGYYIGTLGGLIAIDSATKKITALYNLFSSLRGRITSIKRGNNGDLWIATSGSGLVHFKDGKVIGGLKEKDGLTSDICTSLYIDNNLIWLGTNNGLNRIDLEKENPSITRFTSANGLAADFINAVLATDSSMCVGTAGGLTIFPKNLLTERSVCILHVLQVSENGVKLEPADSYSFSHDALNIQIDFTAISYKSAGDITYSYQLGGLDDKWNTTTTNFINFPTLPPGGYHLFLKATNKFGVVSDTATINIRILPPWWQTLLFRIIALLTIGLIVLAVYRFNVKNIKRKEKTKRDIESRFAVLEQRALQAQMNPHFIFNYLNSIQTFILNFDAEGANNYLTTFASLIRQTLDNSMQPLINITSELKYLETYLDLEKLRFRDKFRYAIYIDDGIDLNNTMLPGMLLQPYVENSLRHGIQHRRDNEGFISVSAKKIDNQGIMYVIKDNGVGRKKAAEMRSSRHIEYQSRGTSINDKRIATINSQFNINIWVKTEDIIDETAAVAGTIVSVFIPTLHK
jgi:hypothetical protein